MKADDKENLSQLQKNDHRVIGKQLKIFYIDPLVGKGLPIWLPNGVAIKRVIKEFIYQQEEKFNYLQVETPNLGQLELFKISGHYEHYKDAIFPVMVNQENEEFMLRPMACPFHIMIYKSQPHSYKELPIRYAEQVKQYRYEPSGSLLGLTRTRAMELTDSHMFLMEDQLLDELKNVYDLITSTLERFKIKIDYLELALHDPNDHQKYHGNREIWLKAETQLRNFLDINKIKYIEKVGEAAFYGPKLDIQIRTNLGHIITVSTIQLDFFLPERFDITYINNKEEHIRPIMIHRGLIGTYERFLSVLLEQTNGDLPMWLAPVQAVILPVKNDLHQDYAKELFNFLKANKIRVIYDDSNERLGNRIRFHQEQKVKTLIVIGDQEVSNRTVSYRFFNEHKLHSANNFEELLMVYHKDE